MTDKENVKPLHTSSHPFFTEVSIFVCVRYILYLKMPGAIILRDENRYDIDKIFALLCKQLIHLN